MTPISNDDDSWAQIGKYLMWLNVISHKNEGSDYFRVITDKYEPNYIKDKIYPGLSFMSNIHPSAYVELTWKELYMVLDGPCSELLIPDGHDCRRCPDRKDCHARFKDDPEQEQCSGWERLLKEGKVSQIPEENTEVPDIEEDAQSWFDKLRRLWKKTV